MNWISVKDKILPNEEGIYLLYYLDPTKDIERIALAFYDENINKFLLIHGTQYCLLGFYISKEMEKRVSYWYLIRSPYKEMNDE